MPEGYEVVLSRGICVCARRRVQTTLPKKICVAPQDSRRHSVEDSGICLCTRRDAQAILAVLSSKITPSNIYTLHRRTVGGICPKGTK